MHWENTERWTAVFRERDAIWVHDGDPRRPHALLTSGRHSDGFVNAGIVSDEPRLIRSACAELVEALGEHVLLDSVTRVVGPAVGVVVMAHCVAHAVGSVTTGPRCRSAFTEKDPVSGRVEIRRCSLTSADEVLVVEDVLTTGGSVERTVEAVLRAGARVVPAVAVLVDRRPEADSSPDESRAIGSRRVVRLVRAPMHDWDPGECVLCRCGSEALRPKESGNWARLCAAY